MTLSLQPAFPSIRSPMVNLLHAFRTAPIAGTAAPPREVVNARIIILALVGACAAILFGYDLGFIGGTITLPAFVKDFDMTHESAADKTAFESNVVSVFQVRAPAHYLEYG